MRASKILAVVVGSAIALFVVALLAVWLLVNPNDFKPRIATAVKNATGRELAMPGDIKLSLFPWIALDLGPASLGNPAGFGDQPFVSFTRASVRVKLLPLLSKRLEVGRIEIDGLDLRLLRNAAGKGNWEDFGSSTGPATGGGRGMTGGPLHQIEGVKVTNAHLTYQKISLSNVSLETGSFVDKGVVPVTLHVEADRGVAGEHAVVDLRFDFSADLNSEDLRVAALNLNSVVMRPGDVRPLRFSVSAPAVAVNLKAQTLSAPAFAVNAAGAEVTGSAAASGILDAMNVTGSVTLAPVVVREYLPRLGMALPATRDPKAFSSVSGAGDFAYGKQSVRFEKLQVTLDDTHLQGSLALNLQSEAVTFDLAVDSMDVDRYLAPAAPPGAPVPRPSAETPKSASPEASRPLDANGTFTAASVHFAPLDLSNVKVTVATADRVMHVFPLKAQVYGGQYSGDMTIDSRTKTPVLSMDEHLSGIDVGKLMASQSKNLHVSGRGNVTLKATGRGQGADAILRTLNGTFGMNVADGAVEGIDLGFELGRAEALIRRQAMPPAQNSGRTRFDAMKMSADIVNGVAQSHDLTLASSVLKITGQGSANLAAKTLDFSLMADTMRVAGNTPLKIPVKVTGSMADPTVRPDIEALAKGQLKEKVQDLLKDKLKGLFH